MMILFNTWEALCRQYWESAWDGTEDNAGAKTIAEYVEAETAYPAASKEPSRSFTICRLSLILSS